jgi:hypothetical protein
LCWGFPRVLGAPTPPVKTNSKELVFLFTPISFCVGGSPEYSGLPHHPKPDSQESGFFISTHFTLCRGFPHHPKKPNR